MKSAFLPFSWQVAGQLDATQASLTLVPIALVFLLVSPMSSAFEQRAGHRGGFGVAFAPRDRYMRYAH